MQNNPKPPQNDHKFLVGGVLFTAIRQNHPRTPNTPMWLVQINESGKTWEPGTAGVSNKSRIKMESDLQELWEVSAKRDTQEWRRQLNLA